MKKLIPVFFLWVISFSRLFANSPQTQVELLLVDSASGSAAATSIAFLPNTSPLFYRSEDVAINLDSTSITPQLYSFTADNIACSSNAYGLLSATTVVRLGAGVSQSGTYIFSVAQYSGFNPASMIFLEDRVLHIFTDLRQLSYTVSINQPSEIQNRFYLHVTYPPVVSSNPAGCANNDGAIIITEDSSIVWSAVEVFDSAGALVLTDTGVTGNFNFRGLPGGKYTLEFDYSVYAPVQTVVVDAHQLTSGMSVASDHGYVGENIQFFTAGSNATQFNWSFGDGSTITGVANPVYFYLSPGVFHVTVNCSNVFGCSGHADTTMYIDVANSIETIDGSKVQMLNDGKSVTVEMDNTASRNYTYSAYNMVGQLIKTGALNNGKTEISFSNEANGVYIITIIGNTSSLSKKVLIAH